MLKLLKLSAVGLVVAGVGTWLVFGSHAGSYLRTAASEVRNGLRDQVPVEFQLKRAEALIQEIEPQLREARRQQAQAEVDLDRLENDIERLTGEVQVGEQKLRHVTAALSGSGEAQFALASYQRDRAELRLERMFDAHRNNVALLQAKQKLIVRQQRTVEAARSHVDAVQAEKLRLQDLIVAVRNENRNVEAMKASVRTVELDDTPLGRAREVVEQAQNDVAVKQKMIEEDLMFSAESPRQSDRDVLAEVQAWMNGEGSVTVDAQSGRLIEVRDCDEGR